MQPYDQNPFPAGDPDRHAIWAMLVHRDIEAFLAQDEAAMAADFEPAGFLGLHGHWSPNPDSWRLSFSFDEYRAEWLRQAKDAAGQAYRTDLREALFKATVLRDIDVHGDMAVAHKKFDGLVELLDGRTEVLNWQTLYVCRRFGDRWKIVGFAGYLPHPMSGARKAAG